MSYRYNDLRRLWMAEQGFVVRQLLLDADTHVITSIWYCYDPDEAAEFMRIVEPHPHHVSALAAGGSRREPNS